MRPRRHFLTGSPPGVPQRPLSGRGAHHFHTSFARLSHGFRAAFARHGTADLAPSRGLRTPGPPAGAAAWAEEGQAAGSREGTAATSRDRNVVQQLLRITGGGHRDGYGSDYVGG